MTNVKSNKSIQQKSKILAILCIAVSFISSGIVFFSIGGVAITPVRIAGVIAFFYSLFILIKRPRTECYNALIICIMIYILVVSVLFSADKVRSLTLVLDYYTTFSFVRIIIFSAKTIKDFNNYLKVFVGGLAVTAIICIYEFLSGNHITANYSSGATDLDTVKYLLKAPTAFLYNPNNIGVLMVIGIPFVFLWIRMIKRPQMKYFGYVLLTIDIAVIFMTGSRGALASAAVLIALYILFSDLSLLRKVLLVGATFFILVYAQGFIFKQLKYGGMLSNGQISLFGEGDGGRTAIATEVIENVVEKYPVFGAGAGGIETITGISAHNFFLEILANFGVVGFMMLFPAILKVGIDVLKIGKLEYKVILGLEMISFIMVMFIPPVMSTLYFVWVAFSLVLVFVRLEKDSE